MPSEALKFVAELGQFVIPSLVTLHYLIAPSILLGWAESQVGSAALNTWQHAMMPIG